MEAFNKIGDNSFPNAAAFLLGLLKGDRRIGGFELTHANMSLTKRAHTHTTNHHRSIFFEGRSPVPTEGGMQADFNTWPFIWRDYARAGYATLYAEDYPPYNLFNYLSRGFRVAPTDHYLR